MQKRVGSSPLSPCSTETLLEPTEPSTAKGVEPFHPSLARGPAGVFTTMEWVSPLPQTMNCLRFKYAETRVCRHLM
jgi:hypothetical protein